jgi:hypothetical protein
VWTLTETNVKERSRKISTTTGGTYRKGEGYLKALKEAPINKRKRDAEDDGVETQDEGDDITTSVALRTKKKIRQRKGGLYTSGGKFTEKKN